MKNKKSKESSYLKYWVVNNLYGWTMSQKLSANKREWIKDISQFNEDFIKNIMKKVDAQYPEKLQELHIDLPFLPERMKIEKIEKLLKTGKTEYVIHIRNLKQAVNHGSILKQKFIE